MILSDHDIFKARESEGLVIEPFNEDLVNPSSMDITLAPGFKSSWGSGEYWDADYKLDNPNATEWALFNYNGTVLVQTEQYVEIPPHLQAQVWDKSSRAREGLSVCKSAGLIDPGFKGTITLELDYSNGDGYVLEAGMKIAQLVFCRLTSPAERPYGHPSRESNYQNQQGITKSVWK